MIVQWCVKGLDLPDDDTAKEIIDRRGGLLCSWWRRVGTIRTNEIRDKLTANGIDRHVNHFAATDPATDRPFSEDTPFISLSAGTVERDTAARTNLVHRARQTALFFGMAFGQRNQAYLYTCWVLVAPRTAVEIEGVAEEVRDLNTYRRYSSWQTEGEVVAKVHVPDNQIRSYEKWEISTDGSHFYRVWTHDNPRFTAPERLSNVRGLI